MKEPFVPHKPEVKLLIEVSAREAHMLKVLRRYQFGKILIQKINGIIIRVEPNESIEIKEDLGLDLEIKKV